LLWARWYWRLYPSIPSPSPSRILGGRTKIANTRTNTRKATTEIQIARLASGDCGPLKPYSSKPPRQKLAANALTQQRAAAGWADA
jgi:hypothetical protein